MPSLHMVSTGLSQDIVRLLLDRGKAARWIAGVLKVDKSFVVSVAAGSRRMSLNQWLALERAVGNPLAYLWIKSIPIRTVRAELRPMYRMTLKLLKPKSPRPKR